MTRVLKPILCWVTERAALSASAERSCEETLVARVREAASAGIDWVQLREKDLDTRSLSALAREVVEAARGSATRIVINDRLDVAWAAGATGVHLGENSLPVSETAIAAQRLSGNRFLVGASCHSQEAAERAADSGADYIFFGPIFATPSKLAFGEPQGLARLEKVCRATKVPVIAIGGIAEENAPACSGAGSAGIAAIRLFQQARDLHALVAGLRSSMV